MIMKIQPLEFERPLAELEAKLEELQRDSAEHDLDVTDQVKAITRQLQEKREEIYRDLTSWQRVQISRHPARPFMLDYVERCMTDFVELHGDRHLGDDNAMPGGFATLGGRRCVVIGHQKGRDTKENLKRNFGSAHPEGYRKALRLMRLAEKFRLPVIALIDTPGAFPGIESEERNIAEAIAFNLREMMRLKTPVIAVVLGEGGSGGALGIGVADRVLMMENAYYSVISPEGCAAILWKHRQHAPEAAEAMRLTARHLQEFGIVDQVIPEPSGGAHRDHDGAAKALRKALLAHLEELEKLDLTALLAARYEKFRQYGTILEPQPEAPHQ